MIITSIPALISDETAIPAKIKVVFEIPVFLLIKKTIKIESIAPKKEPKVLKIIEYGKKSDDKSKKNPEPEFIPIIPGLAKLLFNEV